MRSSGHVWRVGDACVGEEGGCGQGGDKWRVEMLYKIGWATGGNRGGGIVDVKVRRRREERGQGGSAVKEKIRRVWRDRNTGGEVTRSWQGGGVVSRAIFRWSGWQCAHGCTRGAGKVGAVATGVQQMYGHRGVGCAGYFADGQRWSVPIARAEDLILRDGRRAKSRVKVPFGAVGICWFEELDSSTARRWQSRDVLGRQWTLS